MNFGITISFVIGGLLLISVITLNNQVIQNSGEATLNMSAKQTVETVTQVMTRDFLRIGYNTGSDPSDAIQSVTSQKIVFEADIDDDNTESPVRITWEAQPGEKIPATKNNSDYKLTRTVASGPEAGTSTFSVTDFSFTFLDMDGNPTVATEQIRSIRIDLESQAPARFKKNANFEKSFWNKTITPPNLNLAAYQ